MPHRGERWLAPSAVDGLGFADNWFVGLGDARHLRRPFGPRFLSKLLFRGHCDCARFATTPTEPRIRASRSRVVKNSRGVARMSAPSGHRTSRCAAASDMRCVGSSRDEVELDGDYGSSLAITRLRLALYTRSGTRTTGSIRDASPCNASANQLRMRKLRFGFGGLARKRLES
jgi:hypothetical protein